MSVKLVFFSFLWLHSKQHLHHIRIHWVDIRQLDRIHIYQAIHTPTMLATPMILATQTNMVTIHGACGVIHAI